MALFGSGKVKIINENRNDRTEYILDCTKVDEAMVVGKRLVQEFSKEKKLYVFLDTNFSYEKNGKINEANVLNICNKFKECGMDFENKNRMVDKDVSLMGIPMRKKRVREYKVAGELTAEGFALLEYIFPRHSFFVYMFTEEQELEDIFSLHERIHTEGLDYAKLLDWKELQVFSYFDNYFKRIRIATQEEVDIRMLQRIIVESYES